MLLSGTDSMFALKDLKDGCLFKELNGGRSTERSWRCADTPLELDCKSRAAIGERRSSTFTSSCIPIAKVRESCAGINLGTCFQLTCGLVLGNIPNFQPPQGGQLHQLQGNICVRMVPPSPDARGFIVTFLWWDSYGLPSATACGV